MSLTLSEIAEKTGCGIRGDGDKVITGPAPFETAGAGEITFAGGPKYLKRLSETGAGAVIVPAKFSSEDSSVPLLLSDNPQVAFIDVINLFNPEKRPTPGISGRSAIGDSFSCGEDVFIAPFVSVGDSVKLGNRVTLHSGVVLGDKVVVGDDVTIYPNCTILERCKIGSRVIIHAGSVIGSDGFGFAPDGSKYRKIPQLGIVAIDDDVEIGAGNTIDRATYGVTHIKRGVKTDNLVHVAHNVTVGEDTLLVAQVGIAGSVKIGNHAIVAGQAGIAGHLTIGDNAIVGPQAGVGRDVPDGHVVSGSPEMPHKIWLRSQNLMPKLPKMAKRLSKLEKLLSKKKEQD